MRTNSVAGWRGGGGANVWAVLMLLGLALGLAGCSGGGDSGSLEPKAASDTPAPSGPPVEQEAALNLLELYRTAVVEEDIDQLQALLTADGGVEDGQSVLNHMSDIFQRFSVIDLQLQDSVLQGSPTPQAVTLQEFLTIADPDPATFEQRTRARHIRWTLHWRTDPNGTMTVRVAEVMREGPEVEVVMRGQVMAGQPVRIEVQQATGSLALAHGQVEVPETGEVQTLTPIGERWHAVVRAPWANAPKPLQVRLWRVGGESLIVHHDYRVRVPGSGVVQPVVGAQGVSFSAVAVALDGTVWAGGNENSGAILAQVKPGALAASLVGRLLEDPSGGVEDLVVDALGRLHALVFPPSTSGDIVGVVDQGIICPTVNVFNAAYPFQSPHPETGILLPSASTRGLDAGGGDLWLFGSDGGVARVTDAFRGGQCHAPGLAVSYGPIFRREESGLLSNTVTSMVASADTTLWFGTIFGLTRFRGGRFTPQPFLPNSPSGRDITSLEKSIREALQRASRSSSNPSDKSALSLEQFLKALVAELRAAQPLSTVGFEGISFVELFGGPLVKGDLVFSLVEDGQGRLWVGTLGGGLRRVEVSGEARDTLHLTRQGGLGQQCHPGPGGGTGGYSLGGDRGGGEPPPGGATAIITTFSALDGLPDTGAGCGGGRDGTVWLATDHGLYRLLPRGVWCGGSSWTAPASRWSGPISRWPGHRFGR